MPELKFHQVEASFSDMYAFKLNASGRSPLSKEITFDDALRWCREQFGGERSGLCSEASAGEGWYKAYYNHSITFCSQADATAFKMRWC